MAIATVTLPALSRAAIGGISAEFRPTLAKGLRLVLLAKLVLAGAMMAGVCVVANQYLFADLTEAKLAIKVIYLGLTIGVASGVYFAAAKLLQIAEAEDAVGMILRKLRR